MFELGSKFIIMGDWDTRAEPLDKIVIRMPVLPIGCYGFWNTSTRMCISAIESKLQSGMSFLDFGTGSGILAVVAHHLGATPIYAVESNAPISEFAQTVWNLNRVPVQLITGTSPKVDLCVANTGDAFWDSRHLVRAKALVNISNAGKEVVVYA